MTAHPGNRSTTITNNLAESSHFHSRHGIVAHSGDPVPIDRSDPVCALEALRAFDHEHFLEAVGKFNDSANSEVAETMQRLPGARKRQDFVQELCQSGPSALPSDSQFNLETLGSVQR